MIDLHSHILPGIDDGATDMAMSVRMAELALADGVTHMACTPHVMPEVYENRSDDILTSIAMLDGELKARSLDLTLVSGCDAHVCFDMLEKLKSGDILTLNNTRYFLFEPSHHIAPPNIVGFCRRLIAQGFVPVLTHPERLSWLATRYSLVQDMHKLGVVIQLTAASITGRFGQMAQRLSDRMLDDGLVDVIATDAHNIKGRPPGLTEAREAIENRLGTEVAWRLVRGNPEKILADAPIDRTVYGIKAQSADKTDQTSAKGRLFGWMNRKSSFKPAGRERIPT
ncbi:MAG: CpsB/CapC family capsule biosynthesis tyrosine phosphatase [Pseudomonadota bacterium]